NGPGRTFSIRSGVIGKAVRARGVVMVMRQSDEYEAFVDELVREWAYTEHDARKLSSDRRSWMAVPVFDSGSVVCAVVYLDSNQTDFFTPELQQIILDASGGIATYVNEAYR